MLHTCCAFAFARVQWLAFMRAHQRGFLNFSKSDMLACTWHNRTHIHTHTHKWPFKCWVIFCPCSISSNWHLARHRHRHTQKHKDFIIFSVCVVRLLAQARAGASITDRLNIIIWARVVATWNVEYGAAATARTLVLTARFPHHECVRTGAPNRSF